MRRAGSPERGPPDGRGEPLLRDTRTDELAAVGDHDGVAIWRRITDAVAQLANTKPPGPVH